MSKKIFLIIWLIFNNSVLYAVNIPCLEQQRACIEGAGTRIINGISVYRDCWKYDISYKCETDEYIDYCTPIKSIVDCEIIETKCNSSEGGVCLKHSSSYKCKNRLSASVEHEKLIYSLGKETDDKIDSSACDEYSGNKYCFAQGEEKCVDTTDKVINGLNVTRGCWEYEKKYLCKNDSYVESDCKDLEEQCKFKNAQCLSKTDEGECTNYERFYSCTQTLKNNSEALICGSEKFNYERNTDLVDTTSKLNALFTAGESNDGVSIFKGSTLGCDKAKLSANNCCNNSGWANDMGVSSCSGGEKLLAEKKKRGQCHYVGSYCSEKEKITRICLKTRLNYCCFGGKISRVIQEQGRIQLGKSWGGGKHPDCSGLLLSDLDGLDFSLMDFSEIASEVNIKVPAGQSFNDKVKETIENMMRKNNE